MKVIFILALIATLVAFTTAYYPGGQLPSGGRLGATRELALEEEELQRLKLKPLVRDIGRKVIIPKIVDKLQLLDEDEEEEEQRFKIKGLLKEIGRKVIIPKIIDKLQTLEEDDTELQKIKIGKVIRTFVIPKIIAALEESTEDEGAIEIMGDGAEDLVGGHFVAREHPREHPREQLREHPREHPREQLREHPREQLRCFPKWKCRNLLS